MVVVFSQLSARYLWPSLKLNYNRGWWARVCALLVSTNCTKLNKLGLHFPMALSLQTPRRRYVLFALVELPTVQYFMVSEMNHRGNIFGKFICPEIT